MNKKTTHFAVIGFFVTASQFLLAQPYVNGPLSTGATTNSNVAAPSGYTWSECQSQAGNTTESNTSSGSSAYYNAAGTTSFKLADNFVVPTGETWNITSLDFYCYQTGYTGTVPPIDALRIEIYNGDPSLTTSTLVAGSATTNVYNASSSNDALMYRLFNSSTPAPGSAVGTTRKIWKVKGNVTTSLTAGTYWVVYQVHATNDGAVFFPSITIPGVRGLSGWNAKQLAVTTNTWSDVIDTGNPASAPDFPQDFPFDIQYSVILSNDAFTKSNEFKISPNPVKSDFVITIPESLNSIAKSILVYNIQGQEVKSSDILDSYSVSELSSGVYFISVLDESKNILYKSKIIKE